MSATSHDQYVFPDDSRWDDARQSWNLAADLRPAVVVLPTTVDDVVTAVGYAAERDLKIVVQGTGRIRVGDKTLTVPQHSGVHVGPDVIRQVFNDTDTEVL